jgi:hypothetical protein
VSALKEQNLISGEVAGQNLWAESATKVMKAQDGVAMLEAKLPEFIKNAVTITPLGKDGKPLLVKDANGNEVPSTAPIGISEDPVTEKSQLFWMFAIGLDNKYYKEQIIPTLIKCFDAITGSHGKEERITVRTQKKEYYLSQSIERSTLKKLSDLGIKMPSATIGDFSFDRRREPLRIIKSVSRTLDNCECISYSNNPLYGIEGYEHNFHNSQPCLLRVDLYDKNGDLISSDKQGCWQPFFWERSTGINITGPMNLENNYGEGVALPQILFSHIEVPIAISKEIKRVDVSLEVREIKLRLRSSNDR